MKKMFVLTLGLMAAGLGLAQETGRVISSSPIIQQVAVPRQVCSNEQVLVQPPKSGAGAALGTIAGGVLGNAVGAGSGQAAATVIGIVGGAIIGDRVEGGAEPQSHSVQRCFSQNFYENRAVAYNVVYDYAGKQYNVQLPSDPGPTIELQVTPVGVVQQAQSGVGTVIAPKSVIVQSPTVLIPGRVFPSYPVYYPYYPSIGVNFGFGYRSGPQHHGHRHGYRH
ncbi:MAG: hypothetical protein WBI20_05200 [Burkholderiaceae bacterium]